MKNLRQKLTKFLEKSTPKQLRAEIKKRKHLQTIDDFVSQKSWALEYPLIYSLGMAVDSKPIPNVAGKVLRKALKKAKIEKQFNKHFGINTMCLRDDGDTAVYACDIELCLKQVLQNYKPLLGEWD